MNTFFTQRNKEQGFTIIETLVAVAILMISIAGPLTIAYKSYAAAVIAHDQVTASYLAQDAMEAIKNLRDNNILSGSRDWLAGLSSCTSASPCSVNTLTNPFILSTCAPTTTCVLSKDNSGYSPSGSAKSPFYRYLYVTSISGGEAKATVVVSWRSGTTPSGQPLSNQVLYENEIFNVIK